MREEVLQAVLDKLWSSRIAQYAPRGAAYLLWPGARASVPASREPIYTSVPAPITTHEITRKPAKPKRAPRGWRRHCRRAKARRCQVPRLAKRWPPRRVRRWVAREARKALRARIGAAFMGVSVALLREQAQRITEGA